MHASKKFLTRSKAKLASAYRKVNSVASNLLHRQTSRTSTAASRPRLVQDTAPAASSSSAAADTMPQDPPTAANPPQSILQYVRTNYVEGSSIADVSSTVLTDASSSSSPPTGYRGGATSGPGLYDREYTVLEQRRVAENFALWPIHSRLTSMSQPRVPTASAVPALEDEPAQLQGSSDHQHVRTGSPLENIAEHEPSPSVSEEGNVQILSEPAPAARGAPVPPGTPPSKSGSTVKPSCFVSGNEPSVAWSCRAPITSCDNFVVGGSSSLPDPFIDQSGLVSQETAQLQDGSGASRSWTARRWSDFDPEEFPSTENKRLVRIGSQQWELQPPNKTEPKVERANPSQVQAQPQACQRTPAPQQRETFNINDPEGHQPVQPGALAGDWSLPSGMTSREHLRHMEQGLFVAQNALPAVRGLRYAVDRAATDFQALTLENRALQRMAAEYQFKTTQILEPELLRAWEALRERDAEIIRLQGIIDLVSTQGAPAAKNNPAPREALLSEWSAANGAFAYQGHCQYNAAADLPSSQSAMQPVQQPLRTLSSQFYGTLPNGSAVAGETEAQSDVEFETDHLYGDCKGEQERPSHDNDNDNVVHGAEDEVASEAEVFYDPPEELGRELAQHHKTSMPISKTSMPISKTSMPISKTSMPTLKETGN
ncbi:hypothetical protein A1O3_07445 [Capronia epimyces CBS 606.96]|uniref:Uncharacterized protein n=1 Tax=Capronia epimyces CBS 606.96 TaxID=1182542 RepID=W9XUX3_9EURO|nr:uncharacterized protein A1O3_07445 [Capronia epimyces CBS 606.96]EXJ81155.1 hypothetical protein A1O3_07445 [Capronia epimyces CBS 606.96]